MSNEAVNKCLSQWYVMKLHRYKFIENEEMTTHKWPQFVPDDVEHDDVYVMNEFICIHCRNSLRQKIKDAWAGMCKWSAITWHPTWFTKHIAIGEMLFLHKSHS